MVEKVSLVLVMLIAIVFLSAAVSGYFVRMLNLIERTFMAVVAGGGIYLCTHRAIVGQPLTLAAAVSVARPSCCGSLSGGAGRTGWFPTVL